MNDLITYISVGIIVLSFLYFWWETSKVSEASTALLHCLETDDILNALSQGKMAEAAAAYARTINIRFHNEEKTSVSAADFFNDTSVGQMFGFNMKMLDSASGVLVGLGLLGTFFGLTIGISGFDTTTTSDIQASIQGLLNGMGTAFITSLVGMLLSLIFTVWLDKPGRKALHRAIARLDSDLDSRYYIEEYQLIINSQQELIKELAQQIGEKIDQGSSTIVGEIRDGLSYSAADGERSTISNAIRVIMRESEEQTRALKSFSTDLAMELNNVFVDALSQQMQQRLLPLMENIDATTRALIEHIDQVATAVSAPATDMLENIVVQLKESMMTIMDEFKTSLSGSATGELEKLALSLGTATQAMADFPANMEKISATLQVAIEEVKAAIAEITNSTANANSSAMLQMQEQISMATSAMNAAIEQAKEVIGEMSASSHTQTEKMMQELASAMERIGGIVEGTISAVSSNINTSFIEISQKVTDNHTDLMILQEETTAKTEKLLATFNDGLSRLERMNAIVAETMNQFQQAQGHISGTTAHLQTITGDMKLATQLFGKRQTDYLDKLSTTVSKSQEGIKAVEDLLLHSGDLTEEYVEKFGIIHQGLAAIFSQLQSGLSDYSRTVQQSTQNYLDMYSASLTETTSKLSNTISQQNEMVEYLATALDQLKGK